MRLSILVLGGTRLFGPLLVRRLADAGHDVTLATRGRAPIPAGHRHLRIDRRDPRAFAAAFTDGPTYDVVYDQLCYSPLDAQLALRVFRGRVARYVMASTIEVYDRLYGTRAVLRESDLAASLAPGGEPLDPAIPWHAPDLPDAHYGLGKRLAEATFHRDGGLPVLAVRIGHVLAGPEDFTGRLAWYVRRARRGEPLAYSAGDARSSFIGARELAAFLARVGTAASPPAGPINAASLALSALELHRRVEAVTGYRAPVVAVADAPRSTLSPFDHASPYRLDTTLAAQHGYAFATDSTWLDDAIAAHAIEAAA